MQAGPYDAYTDEQLWQLLREGDEVAFKALHVRHYNVLYRYGTKVCPDKEIVLDCLQEVYYQLWHRQQKLAKVKSVRFYLMKWLKRELVRTLTKKQLGTFVDLDSEEGLQVALTTEDLFEKGQEDLQRTHLLKKAIETLSPREREVIYMRFFLELTYEEICLALNLSYQVVMNYLSRALKTLRTSQYLDKLLLICCFSMAKIIGIGWLVIL
jgi:RNA polymerase sigma factor (sigma-70 family)